MTLDQAGQLAIGLDAAMIVFTLAILQAGGLSRRTTLAMGVVGFGWLAALFVLFSNDAPFPDDISGPGFYAVVLGGVGLTGVLLLGPGGLRSTLVAIDQTWLLGPQGIRVFFGAMFLVWAGEGVLPRTFGLVDGLTHLSAGFLGLIAAWSLGRAPTSTMWAWLANVFGLVDILVVATSVAFILLADIGPHHPMMYAVFAPAPVWLWLHVISLYRLVRPRPGSGAEKPTASRPDPSSAPVLA